MCINYGDFGVSGYQGGASMRRLYAPTQDAENDVDIRIRPKCFTCGNTRTFFVSVRSQVRVWDSSAQMPSDGKIVSCGRCRSKNSIIMDYSD
jgi:hypothetical protein